MDYRQFLEKKKIKDDPSGFDPGELNDKLFDFQKDIVRWACQRGRAAIFADCGLGKTPMQLEWAQKVHEKENAPVLILAPLAVSLQTEREGQKFGYKVNVCKDHGDAVNGINITNYEKLDKFDTSYFSGVVLDESSILKSFMGKTKQKIMDVFKNTKYKLCCTATPSPNDHMEILNHSAFLNVMKSNEALAIWFINDTMNIGKYRIKKHAIRDFWKWVSSWAVSFSKPSDLGYSDYNFKLPELQIKNEIVEVDLYECVPDGMLFRVPEINATSVHAEKRLTCEVRINRVIDILNKIGKGPVMIWCETNYEADMLRQKIPSAIEVRGNDKPAFKESTALKFSNGEIDILISKPSIFGFGLNFQVCHKVIFSSLSFSYESFYQTIRRFWRFGQKENVQVHVVIAETEKQISDAIKNKESMFKEMKTNMQKEMTKYQTVNKKVEYLMDYDRKEHNGMNYKIINGDAVEEIKGIKTDSIGFTIFSPPFSSLYIYSDSFRDMGNTKTDDEFFKHFGFLIPELYRVTMPGRLCAIHCKQLVDYKGRDGSAGLRDFRGYIIRAMEHGGWKYHSEVCIWKDPVIEMQRTKAQGLLHKQIKRDGSLSRTGLPDYLVVFRKWPVDGTTNSTSPVKRVNGFEYYVGEDNPKKTNLDRKDTYSINVWQRYASPVWFDIRQTNVLNCRLAREGEDEKHICPLQLDVIERAIHLWSNENDVVFSPFAGVGSEGYCAIKQNRKFIGIELKKEYFIHAIKNIESARSESYSLFA